MSFNVTSGNEGVSFSFDNIPLPPLLDLDMVDYPRLIQEEELLESSIAFHSGRIWHRLQLNVLIRVMKNEKNGRVQTYKSIAEEINALASNGIGYHHSEQSCMKKVFDMKCNQKLREKIDPQGVMQKSEVFRIANKPFEPDELLRLIELYNSNTSCLKISTEIGKSIKNCTYAIKCIKGNTENNFSVSQMTPGAFEDLLSQINRKIASLKINKHNTVAKLPPKDPQKRTIDPDAVGSPSKKIMRLKLSELDPSILQKFHPEYARRSLSDFYHSIEEAENACGTDSENESDYVVSDDIEPKIKHVPTIEELMQPEFVRRTLNDIYKSAEEAEIARDQATRVSMYASDSDEMFCN